MTNSEKTKFEEVIEEIIKNLKEEKEFKISDKHESKIREGLEGGFSKISNQNVEKNKDRLIDKVSKALVKDRTWWTKVKNFLGLKESYEVSSKAIIDIAKQEVETLGIALEGADKVRSEVKKKGGIQQQVIPKSIQKELEGGRSSRSRGV